MQVINIGSIVIQYLSAILIILILHYKIGEYPDPLPPSETPKREILETFLIYVIVNAYLLIFVFGIRPKRSEGNSDLTLQLLFDILIIHLPQFLLLLYFSVNTKRLTAKDLGFSTNLQPSHVSFFAIAYGLIIGITRFFIGLLIQPIPIEALLLLVFANAFIEEFIYRSIIQTKLENLLGQGKAWFLTGILFGLAHLISDYSGPFSWDNAVLIVLNSISKIINGMILGIIYMKTRSLIPVVTCHYLLNWTPAIMLLFLG